MSQVQPVQRTGFCRIYPLTRRDRTLLSLLTQSALRSHHYCRGFPLKSEVTPTVGNNIERREAGMRNSILIAAMSTLMLAPGMACAQKPTASTRQPIPALPSSSPKDSPGGFTNVDQLRAMPNTIQFMANNPGGVVISGSVATITWDLTQGRNGRTWTLMVGTSSSSFLGCTTVPVSAVSVKCVSASVSGGGQTSAGCNLTTSTTLPNTLPGLP